MKTTQKLQKGLSIVLTLMMLVQVASPISYAQESMPKSDLIKGGFIIDDTWVMPGLPEMTRPTAPEYRNVEATVAFTSINPRAARLELKAEYQSAKSDNKVVAFDAMITALRMHAMQTIGPRCARIADAASQTRILERSSVSAAANQMTTQSVKEETIPSVCIELFYDKLNDQGPSEEFLKVLSTSFSSFYPNVNFDSFVAGIMDTEGSRDVDTYIKQILGQNTQQVFESYIIDGILPNNPVCPLSPEQEKEYNQAKKSYTQAIDNKDGKQANEAFNQMAAIVSAAGCDQQDSGFNPNPECVQKITILRTNLLQIANQDSVDYKRIQGEIDALMESSSCTMETRSSALAIQPTLRSPSLSSEVLTFGINPINVPNDTNLFCTSTAFTLQEQLQSARLFALTRLNNSIATLKQAENLSSSKMNLATLFQNETVAALTQKQSAMGLFKPASALESLLTMGVNLVNMVLSAQAGYDIVDDLLPNLEKYIEATRYTSLRGMFDSVERAHDIMSRGPDLIWNGNRFDESKQSAPGIRMALADGWSATLRQLSALQYKDLYQEQSWTKQILNRSLTNTELSQIYFRNVDRENLSQNMQDLLNNSYTTVYFIDGSVLSDTLYTQLLRTSNNNGFGLSNDKNIPVMILSANGQFYPIITTDNQTISTLPPATYTGSRGRIVVASDGTAIIDSVVTTTLPHDIDVSVRKAGQLLMAMKGKVTWPDELPPLKQPRNEFSRQELIQVKQPRNEFSRQEMLQEMLQESRMADTKMADTVESTEGEMVKAILLHREAISAATRKVGGDTTMNNDIIFSTQALANGVVGNAATTASSAVKREREFALPTAITISLYLKPITISINLARVNSNGTNTITLNATVTGPSICNATLNASVTYKADEFGMPPRPYKNDIRSIEGTEVFGMSPMPIEKNKGEESSSLPIELTAASLSLNIKNHTFVANSSNPNALIQAVMGNGQDNISNLFNTSITATFAALGQTIGSLSLNNKNELIINYADGSQGDFIDMLFRQFDNIKLGWLEDILGKWFDRGGDSLWVNTAEYNIDKNTGEYNFYIEYGDRKSDRITVDNAQVTVSNCDNMRGCTSSSYMLQQQPDGRYFVAVPAEQIDQFSPVDGGRQEVYAEAWYAGMYSNYEFFNRPFNPAQQQQLLVNSAFYNPRIDDNQQNVYDFFIQYGDNQGNNNISVDNVTLTVSNCDNMSGCTEDSYSMNRGGDGYRLTLPTASIDGYNPPNGGNQQVYAEAWYAGSYVRYDFINRAFMGGTFPQ